MNRYPHSTPPPHTHTRMYDGFDQSNDGITRLLCTNGTDSHKLNPLSIGKFAKSRSFHHVNMKTAGFGKLGRLRGLAVACWTTDHYHPCSNVGVGISEGCFIFDFASLFLEVARPI